MSLTCYYCNTSGPRQQMKRCSRCLLVTYCSKECQTASWKSSHKYNCKVHPSIASPDDPNKPVSKADRPKKFTEEWENLQIDKALSRWLQLWRSSFCTWTVIALDLANHPPDRVMTHCMRLIIQPSNFEEDTAKQYELIDASIVEFAEIVAEYPDIDTFISPTDFTRFRFVILLQDDEGDMVRMRLFQWNDSYADLWRKMDKEESARLSSGWAQSLAFSLNNLSPAEMEEMLGKNQQGGMRRIQLPRPPSLPLTALKNDKHSRGCQGR